MTFVAKRKEDDCATCAISMATGLPYKKVRAVLYKGQMRKPKGGVTNQAIDNCLKALGLNVIENKAGTFRSIYFELAGREAVVSLDWKTESFNHAVYWNGRYFLDSCHPGKKIQYSDYVEHINSINPHLIATPLWKRTLNIGYGLIKETQDFFIEFCKELNNMITSTLRFCSYI